MKEKTETEKRDALIAESLGVIKDAIGSTNQDALIEAALSLMWELGMVAGLASASGMLSEHFKTRDT